MEQPNISKITHVSQKKKTSSFFIFSQMINRYTKYSNFFFKKIKNTPWIVDYQLYYCRLKLKTLFEMSQKHHVALNVIHMDQPFIALYKDIYWHLQYKFKRYIFSRYQFKRIHYKEIKRSRINIKNFPYNEILQLTWLALYTANLKWLLFIFKFYMPAWRKKQKKFFRFITELINFFLYHPELSQFFSHIGALKLQISGRINIRPKKQLLDYFYINQRSHFKTITNQVTSFPRTDSTKDLRFETETILSKYGTYGCKCWLFVNNKSDQWETLYSQYLKYYQLKIWCANAVQTKFDFEDSPWYRQWVVYKRYILSDLRKQATIETSLVNQHKLFTTFTSFDKSFFIYKLFTNHNISQNWHLSGYQYPSNMQLHYLPSKMMVTGVTQKLISLSQLLQLLYNNFINREKLWFRRFKDTFYGRLKAFPNIIGTSKLWNSSNYNKLFGFPFISINLFWDYTTVFPTGSRNKQLDKSLVWYWQRHPDYDPWFKRLSNSMRKMRQIKLKYPSKQIAFHSIATKATVGQLSNIEHNQQIIGKAGINRIRNTRPIVRGVAMNPIDHPHGGKTSGGRPSVSPWGRITK